MTAGSGRLGRPGRSSAPALGISQLSANRPQPVVLVESDHVLPLVHVGIVFMFLGFAGEGFVRLCKGCVR